MKAWKASTLCTDSCHPITLLVRELSGVARRSKGRELLRLPYPGRVSGGWCAASHLVKGPFNCCYEDVLGLHSGVGCTQPACETWFEPIADLNYFL